MSAQRPNPSERRLARAVRIAVFSMTLAAGHAAVPAIAAEAPAAAQQTYQLPAGPLGRTLSSVAVGAGVPLSFDPALTAGLSSPALQGSYTRARRWNACSKAAAWLWWRAPMAR
ncbi:hypothetical protein [Duganella sp. P38]|uniref:hypothetical protein n=1 Tax=Duganella sp. P38 TaxID=3423949 RepID=UPI003D7B067E